MHFDARVWRTLPLLAFNPGRLTREWVEGRRTRYVSPLAIFLFTLFVMFFALSFMPQPSAPVVLAGDIQEQRQELLEAERGLAEARAEAASDPSGMADMGIKAGEALVAQKRAALARLETEQSQGRADGLKPGSWQASIKDIASGEDVSGGTTKLKVMGHEADKDDHGFGATVLKKLQNPDLALYKLQQTMYKFAFLLVPFSIPFLALLFLWRRGFTLYDHGVFVLYSLTFMALLLMVIVLARTINGPLGGLVTAIGVAAIPVHVFAQLKGAYSLSIFSALWRTVLLLFFCNIVIGLFVMAIVYLGLGH
jgi:hypothetical protein